MVPLEDTINPMWTLFGVSLPPDMKWFYEVVDQTVKPRVLHLVIRYLGNFNEFESLSEWSGSDACLTIDP